MTTQVTFRREPELQALKFVGVKFHVQVGVSLLTGSGLLTSAVEVS